MITKRLYRGWVLTTHRMTNGRYVTLASRVRKDKALDITQRSLRKAHEFFNTEHANQDMSLVLAQERIDDAGAS